LIITAVDHITINLSAIQESFEFYNTVLELENIKNVDMGDHVLHLYQLPGAQLELIEYKNNQKVVQADNTDIGVYRHFALCTDDIKEIERRCEEMGYGINLPPAYISQIEKTVMLIKDPNGVEIEIIQNQQSK